MGVVVLHSQKMGQHILRFKHVVRVTPGRRKGSPYYHQIRIVANVISKRHSSKTVTPNLPSCLTFYSQVISILPRLMRSTQRINSPASTSSETCIFKELKILNNKPKEHFSQILIRLILQMSKPNHREARQQEREVLLQFSLTLQRSCCLSDL